MLSNPSMICPQEYVHSLEHHTDWVNDIILCMEGQHSTLTISQQSKIPFMICNVHVHIHVALIKVKLHVHVHVNQYFIHVRVYTVHVDFAIGLRDLIVIIILC